MKHYAYNSPFKMKDQEGVEYTLEVINDDCPESPRVWDNLCTMICWHRYYDLGDRHNYDDVDDFLDGLCFQILYKDCDELYGLNWQDKFTMLDESNLILIKAINMYDHSGVTISTSSVYPYNDPWDAVYVGFIYVTKKKIFEECGDITEENWKERADKYLEGEMKTYDQYLRGDVYGYKLTKKVTIYDICPHCGEVVKEHETEEDVDGCWGFYGDCLEENGILDYVSDLEFVEED